MARTIVLQNHNGVAEEGRLSTEPELKPGHCVDITSGEYSVAAANSPILNVLKEDALQGRGIDDGYDNNGEGSNAHVFIHKAGPGDVLLVRAVAATYADGDPLQIVADGRVGMQTSTNPIVAIAESVDGGNDMISGNDGEQEIAANDGLLRVRCK